jgi:hypothetical protein
MAILENRTVSTRIKGRDPALVSMF